MAKKKKPTDINKLASQIVAEATQEEIPKEPTPKHQPKKRTLLPLRLVALED